MKPLSWVERTDRNFLLITREFSRLNITRLTYTSQLYGCGIKEVLIHLLLLHSSFIMQMEEGMRKTQKTRFPESYRQRWSGKIILKFRVNRPWDKEITKHPHKNFSKPEIFSMLDQQHQKIKELLSFYGHSDVNKKIIRLGRRGLFRMSAGDMFEYVLAVQDKHLMLARRILMLQDL